MKTLTHTIRLDMPADDAFPLFTPKGEESWVPGWQPRYIAPVSGETRPGMIFITGEGEEETIWTCTAFDRVNRHAAYFRVVPGSRVSLVDVRCKPSGPKSTSVEISYSHSALSENGGTFIANITPQSFAADIDGWKTLIERTLTPEQTAGNG